MGTKQIIIGLLLLAIIIHSRSIACSPCGALSNVTQTLNGTNLELTFTSNAGWNCCYTVQIEIVCANASFTGIPNYSSSEICLNGGTGAATTNTLQAPYPLTVINLSTFCPGNYKWRGVETGCGIYRPEQTFTVAGASPIVIDASLAEDTICPTESTQFSSSATGSCNSGAFTYSWSPATGLNNANIASPLATPLTTTTYTLTVTENGSCTAPQNVAFTIIVNPLPTVFAGNDITLCEGETATLVGSGANTYSWDNNVTNAVAFAPSVGTITYTVTGTSTVGCVDSDQVNVLVNPLPLIVFTPDVTMGCIPLTVNFTNATPNSSNCVWTMSDGTVLTGCGTVTNVFDQAGCFDITVTTTNGCTSTFTASDLICVAVDPIAAFTPSVSSISELNPVVYFNNTTTGASDYIWSFGDNTQTSTAINPSHDFSQDGFGNYVVTLLAFSQFGCVDTAYATIQIYEELIFYIPNTFTPDNDNFNPIFQPIFTSGFDPYDYNLMIFNRWGEIISESHNADIGWDGSYGSNGEINMVQDGTYTWKIEFKTTANDERKMVVGHVNVIR